MDSARSDGNYGFNNIFETIHTQTNGERNTLAAGYHDQTDVSPSHRD